MGNPILAIKKQRQALKFSQWALAKKVGRSGPWLSLRETGYVYPTAGEVRALQLALDRLVQERESANDS